MIETLLVAFILLCIVGLVLWAWGKFRASLRSCAW
jgi:hypothetical protein